MQPDQGARGGLGKVSTEGERNLGALREREISELGCGRMVVKKKEKNKKI